MADHNISRDDFITRIHRIIGDNIEVQAVPTITPQGAIVARGRLLIGDVDDDVEKLADDLGFPARPIVPVDQEPKDAIDA